MSGVELDARKARALAAIREEQDRAAMVPPGCLAPSDELPDELWGMAVLRGTCKACGRELVREMLVNRDWTNLMDRKVRMPEPVPFGYMGDCVCGKPVGGTCEWPWLIVWDEEAE